MILFNMQAKLLIWNYHDLLSKVPMKKMNKRNTKCEFVMKEIIELSKCGDVMMSFNCQTEREPVVAQGPSVPWCCLL